MRTATAVVALLLGLSRAQAQFTQNSPIIFGPDFQKDPTNGQVQIADIRKSGAKCDGTSNDSAAFNAAITAVNGVGGGIVQVPAGKSCVISSTVTLKSNVQIALNKATVKWIGPAAGPIFATSTSTPTNSYGISGGTINIGSSLTGSVFALNSGLKPSFRDIDIVGGGGTGTVLDLAATVMPHDPVGSTNLAWGLFENVTAYGDIGTCVKLSGLAASPDANGVTLNTFIGVRCFVVETIGVDFEKWSDSNIFYNFFAHISGSGSKGVVFNNADPTNNAGVYQNTFYSLAIDTGTDAGLKRTGILVNYSGLTAIYDYAQYPYAENGPILNPNNNDILVTFLDAGTYKRTFYPGSGFVWGQDFVIAGVHTSNSNTISTAAATGLGSGGTATVFGGSASNFQVQLTAGTGAAANGTFQMIWPTPSGGITCIAGAQNGTGIWTTPVTVLTAGADATHHVFAWDSNAALTAGQTYFINANCHQYCSSGGHPC